MFIRVHPWFFFLVLSLSAAGGEIERPFMIWTRAEAESIRARVAREDWARRELERMTNAVTVKNRSVLENYFLALVAGDTEAEAHEYRVITNISKPLFSPEYEEVGESWIGSNPGGGKNYDWAIRFDFFWNALSPEIRRKFDDRFHVWSAANFEKKGGMKDPAGYEDRGAMTSSFLALATGDKRLVRAAFEGAWGFQGYMDGMVDGYFTPRGDSPDVHHIGGILLWCLGAERLGMNEAGFGYVGKPSADSGQGTGGTVRKLVEGYFQAGDPRVDIPGGAPFYGRAAMTLSSRVRSRDFFEFITSYSIPGSAAAGGSSPSRLGFSLPNLRHPRDVFRAPIVIGRLRDAPGGWPWMLPFRNDLFYSVDRVPRSLTGLPEIEYNKGIDPLSMGIQLPLAFELAHKLWPDAGFAYFLARMDPSDSETYYPSLFWNLDPFPKAKATPPPVSSTVLPTVGMALLRSQEGPEFWDSPAPYAVLRLVEGLGTEIAPSALSLHSFQAFHRPIYRYVVPPARMPAGVEHGMTHNTVVVDNAPRPGTGRGRIRRHFAPGVKFVSARSTPYEHQQWVPGAQPMTSNLVAQISGVRPGVAMERSLALTREYLFDVFLVESGQEHTYDWLVHALGSASPDDPAAWKPAAHLDSTLGIRVPHTVSGGVGAPFTYHLTHAFGDPRGFDPQGKTWSLNLAQTAMTEDPAKTVMGPEWYGRKVGARVTMLGEAGTGAFYAREMAPRRLTAAEAKRVEEIRFPKRLKGRDGSYDKADQEATEIPLPSAGGAAPKKTESAGADESFQPVGEPAPVASPETGGVVLIAERRATNTMFVALHEPFENLTWKISEFRRIQQTKDAVAVAIRGQGVDDRVMVRQGADAENALALSDGAESFRFTGFAYVRIGADAVTACGDLTAMKVKVQGNPRLSLNGQETPAVVRGGFLVWGQ